MLNTFALPLTRIAIGFTQGIFLYCLYHFTQHFSLTHQPYLLMSLFMLITFIPLLLIQGMRNLRPHTFALYVCSIILLLIALSIYSIYRFNHLNSFTDPLMPFSFSLLLISPGFLFILHALVTSGDHDQKWIGDYSTYFSISWKLMMQLVLVPFFVFLFWIVLWIGVALFEIIHLDFFSTLIFKPWFYVPATTTVLAIGLHATDVHARLTDESRKLNLMLLSWLLPIALFIVSLFLASLFYTGLTPLWQTHHATPLLTGTALILIVFINAVYQDGEKARSIPSIQRFCTIFSCILLVPLIALSIQALSLRVQQYGWSVDRIYAATILLVLSSYALGYAFAACTRLHFIERCNVFTALFMVVLSILLLSPFADPARLMVMNQVDRLQSGLVAPDRFDYRALKTQGLRYGYQALETLQNIRGIPHEQVVRDQAKMALTASAPNNPTINLKEKEKKNLIQFHSSTKQTLPESFLTQAWGFSDKEIPVPSCLHQTNHTSTCHVWMLNTPSSVILVLDDARNLVRFQNNDQGKWEIAGYWNLPYSCYTTLRSAIIDGKFKLVKHVSEEVEVLGMRLPFQANISNSCSGLKTRAF